MTAARIEWVLFDWGNFEGSDLHGLFELPMSSHLIGASKPSRAAFETALQRMETEPERVVFIDDKAANVDAARAVGMHAFVTDSVAATRRGLAALIDIAPLAAVLLALVGMQGCSGDCDENVINRAVVFLDANQSCTTDDDCTVVSDHCAELPGGFCGQLPMNREGAESDVWKSLEDEVEECAPDSCEVCGAALVPTCTNGSCRGAQQ